MCTPHRHKDIITAWANGETIQVRAFPGCDWKDLIIPYPHWDGYEYRIKPKKRTPYQVYADAGWPEAAPHVHQPTYNSMNKGLQGVVNAAKAGEFDE